jgi:plasmid maintenance system antidote protein VapI
MIMSHRKSIAKPKSPGARRLAEYLHKQNESQTAFARRIGVTPGLVHQWLEELTEITAERCVQIERETGGAVSRVELRPDLFFGLSPQATAQ